MTERRLATLQCEYDQLMSQTAMLQGQLPELQCQVEQLYTCGNRVRANQVAQRIRSVQRTINRNQMRMSVLTSKMLRG